MANRKVNYHTRQRDELESYLQQVGDRQLTMQELADGASSAHAIGRSTVYRLVGTMVEEGSLRRFRGKDDKSVLYQYVGKNSACNSHLHLKCSRCGRIIHLDCEEAEAFRDHLLQQHGFAVDVRLCTLYGLCEACREVEA